MTGTEVGRTGALSGSGTQKGPQLMCQGILAFAAAVPQAVSGGHRFLSDNQVFLACPVMQRTDFVGVF